MDEKTRELYAAIGRGEIVQWKHITASDWDDWGLANTIHLGEISYQWRIKPKTRKVTIDGVNYEFPEPLKEAPEGVDEIWAVLANRVAVGDKRHLWSELQNGKAQLTKEGAEAQLRAERALRGLK